MISTWYVVAYVAQSAPIVAAGVLLSATGAAPTLVAFGSLTVATVLIAYATGRRAALTTGDSGRVAPIGEWRDGA